MSEKVELNESELSDLSKYAVDLNFDNRFYEYPLIERAAVGKADSSGIMKLLNIALTIDTLAMLYEEQSGGIMPDGKLFKPNTRGQMGREIYNNYKIVEKLNATLRAIENDKSISLDSKELSPIKRLLVEKFLSDSAYFNSRKLEEAPFAIISLELSLIENRIYSFIRNHIEQESSGR